MSDPLFFRWWTAASTSRSHKLKFQQHNDSCFVSHHIMVLIIHHQVKNTSAPVVSNNNTTRSEPVCEIQHWFMTNKMILISGYWILIQAETSGRDRYSSHSDTNNSMWWTHFPLHHTHFSRPNTRYGAAVSWEDLAPAPCILSAARIKHPQDFHKFKAPREKNRRAHWPRPYSKSWRHVSLWMVRRIRTTPCQAPENPPGTCSLSKGRWTEREQRERNEKAVEKRHSNAFWASHVQ